MVNPLVLNAPILRPYMIIYGPEKLQTLTLLCNLLIQTKDKTLVESIENDDIDIQAVKYNFIWSIAESCGKDLDLNLFYSFRIWHEGICGSILIFASDIYELLISIQCGSCTCWVISQQETLHEKMKFSRKLRIWSHLLKKSLMRNFIFCAAKRFDKFSYDFKHIFSDRVYFEKSLENSNSYK